MKNKKYYLVFIGLLIICALVISPTINAMAIGTFIDENGRVVHPVVNPDSKINVNGDNLPYSVIGKYNEMPTNIIHWNQLPKYNRWHLLFSHWIRVW